MDTGFVLGQVFGFVALIFVCISYFTKNRTVFLFLNIIANFFYGGAFLSQNLLVAGVDTIVSIARTVGLYIYVKTKNTPNIQYFLLNLSAYFITTSVFFKSPLDLIVLSTSVLFTIAYFSPSLRWTRAIAILPNIALTIYNLTFSLYASALLGAIEAIVATCSVIYFELQARRSNKARI